MVFIVVCYISNIEYCNIFKFKTSFILTELSRSKENLFRYIIIDTTYRAQLFEDNLFLEQCVVK